MAIKRHWGLPERRGDFSRRRVLDTFFVGNLKRLRINNLGRERGRRLAVFCARYSRHYSSTPYVGDHLTSDSSTYARSTRTQSKKPYCFHYVYGVYYTSQVYIVDIEGNSTREEFR